jgi:hypothetical protein
MHVAAGPPGIEPGAGRRVRSSVDTIEASQPLSIPSFGLPDKKEVAIIQRLMLGNGETGIVPSALGNIVADRRYPKGIVEVLNISARVKSAGGAHWASVETNGVARSVPIPAKAQGVGSSVNGGELLFLAPATCICNGVFDDAGGARNIRYRTEIASNGSRDALGDLVRYVDEIAEIHRAVRTGTPIELAEVTIHAGEGVDGDLA